MKSLLSTLVLGFGLSFIAAHGETTQSVTDDLGRTVTVPLNPQRIVSLHDTSLTVALLELGVMPVGSHGRVLNDTHQSMRSSKLMTGIDFDNSSIKFVGATPADPEKVAAVKPDLILTTSWQTADVNKLSAIAPTYVFDISQREDFDIYADIANLVGKSDQVEQYEARYQSQLQQIRDTVDVSKTKVAIIQAHGGEMQVWNTYGSLGKVLRDAGFAFPDIVNNIAGNERQTFSGEVLPEFDADMIFITYRPQRGETPADAADKMAEVLPQWCEVLKACANGQVVYLPRSETTSSTYNSLGLMAYTVISHLTGREFIDVVE